MINHTFFGYVGTTLNIVMLLPQVYRALKTKDIGGLSLTSFLVFLIACVFWILYGIGENSWPIIITNVVVGCLNVILIILKLKFK